MSIIVCLILYKNWTQYEGHPVAEYSGAVDSVQRLTVELKIQSFKLVPDHRNSHEAGEFNVLLLNLLNLLFF